MTEADKIRFHQQCAIIARAEKLKLIPNDFCKDRFTLAMDLEYANDGKDTQLNLDNLMKFDDLNFGHDINGICHNIQRFDGPDRGTMLNCFSPRCGWVKN